MPIAEAKRAKYSHVQTGVINIIIKAADKAEVPRELLLAVCWVESSYRTKLKPHMDGKSHSYGLCQVKLETAQYMDEVYNHKWKATPEKLNDPYLNAFYAAKVLKWNLSRYQGDWKKAVDAYNKGRHVSTESEYVKRVYKALEQTVPSKHLKFQPLVVVVNE